MSGENSQGGAGGQGGFWQRRIDRSPLMHVLRKLRGVPTAEERALTGCGLDGELVDAIRRVARLTRLKRHEREEVARELVSHGRDAVASGRSAGDVVRTMGEARVVAKLIRRSMLRKRSALYQSWFYVSRGTLAMVGGLIVLYVGWSVWFYMGEPEPKVNYVGLLNERSLSLAPEERAWPLYLEGYAEIHAAAEALNDEVLKPRLELEKDAADIAGTEPERDATGLDASWLEPGDPDYGDVTNLFAEHSAAFEKLRRAADRRGVGFVYSTRGLAHERPPVGPAGSHDPQDVALRFEVLPPAENIEEQAFMVNILLPHLSALRGSARYLAKHAVIAAKEGDADTAAADLEAIFGIAGHACDEPFLIGYLTGVAIEVLAIEATQRVLQDSPGLFTREQLQGLAHRLAGLSGRADPMSLGSERSFMDDFLQRTYTDDGDGGGRLTAQGVSLLHDLETGEGAPVSGPGRVVGFVVAPAVGLVSANRRDISRRYHSFIDRMMATPNLEPMKMVAEARAASAFFDEMSGFESFRYMPLTILTPSLSRAMNNESMIRLYREAGLAVLATHAFRLEAGRYPETLEELVPRLLPRVPADPFNPSGDLVYRVTADGFELYSVGSDGDDDGGRTPAGRGRANGSGAREIRNLFARYPEPDGRVDGDLLLYPAADD